MADGGNDPPEPDLTFGFISEVPEGGPPGPPFLFYELSFDVDCGKKGIERFGPPLLEMCMNLFWNIFRKKRPGFNSKEIQEAKNFIENFIGSDVYFLSLSVEEGIQLNDLTPEALLQKTKEGAENLKSAESHTVFYHHYAGKTILPLFSKMEMASAYWGDFCKKMGQVIPVGMLQVKGRSIIKAFGGVDLVLLNPMCPEEKVLDKRFIECVLENIDLGQL